MAKEHYWTPLRQEDDHESSLDTTVPLVTHTAATRAVTDTLLRVEAWMTCVAAVSGTSAPPVYWLEDATVDYLFEFDTTGSDSPVNIDDASPYTVGFCRLELSVHHTTVTGQYQAIWQGPVAGLKLQGRRKGYSPSILPTLNVQRWVADNNGVFDNFAHYGVTFGSKVVGRVLWASDLPASP
jgi:hypothetical protein